MSGEDVEYSGDWEQVRARDPLPTDGRNQSCAVCGDARVLWLHPLSEEHAVFMMGGAEYTLPTFWMLCDGCEEANIAGEVALTSRIPKGEADLDRAAVIAFRRADLGGRSLV